MHPKPFMGQKNPKAKTRAQKQQLPWADVFGLNLVNDGRGRWENSENSEEFILAKGIFKFKSNPHPHPSAQPLIPIHMLRSPLWNW